RLSGDVDLDWSDLMLSPISSSLDRYQCQASFNQHEIHFRHLFLQRGRSDLAFKGSLFNGSGERFLKGEISSSNLILSDLLDQGGKSRSFSWPMGLKVELTGQLDHLLLPSGNEGFRPVGQDAPWQNFYQCRFALAGNPDSGLSLKRFSWLWGKQKSAVSIKADLDSFPDVGGRILIEAENLNLDKLLQAPDIEMAAQEEDSGMGEGAPDKQPERITAFEELTDVVESDEVSRLMEWKEKLATHNLQIEVRARHLTWKNLVLDQLAGEATIDKTGVDITRIDGRSFDGDIYFSGNWWFADDLFSLDSEFSGINFEKFNDYLKNPDRGLPMQGGEGSLTLALDWQGQTLSEWKKNLDGLISFNFKDGKLKRFTLISNICSLLNVSQFASLRLPKFSNGVPYRSMSGQGTIVGGVMTIDDFTLQGPGLNLLATGKVSLVDEEIDLKMGIQPLQTVDKLLATIPVLGYIMTGDKKTFVIIPVTAKGPFNDVKISTKTVTGLGEKVGDIIQRFFTTPVRLFKMSGQILQPSGR
ncbi:MAG: AsmA-like C-terminal region-containing protein, partial [Deltaproteobacteria bacterium]|nr:AsmA-like C-terminal region-containing protein [Deltaproteobacteria bacterium]